MRKPLQGVSNIIRFNWHYYVIAFILVFLLVLTAGYFSKTTQTIIYVLSVLVILSVLISLFISLYVYDLSGFYNLRWIGQTGSEKLVVNINAGFDETSELLKYKFYTAEIIACDFYDPENHTEISIKRARKAYPPYHNTKQITTGNLPLPDNSADKIFLILSAHEIRNEKERITFFKELKRVLKPSGQIYVSEHLRNISNFLAYNIGFFHFYSKNTWLNTFENSALKIKQEIKLTPFISTFILAKNGNTL